jgi:hypothetical protein
MHRRKHQRREAAAIPAIDGLATPNVQGDRLRCARPDGQPKQRAQLFLDGRYCKHDPPSVCGKTGTRSRGEYSRAMRITTVNLTRRKKNYE